MINNAYDVCFNCNIFKHFANECQYEKIINHLVIDFGRKAIELFRSNVITNINDLVSYLNIIDDTIFSNINEEQLIKWIKYLNKLNIKGTNIIDINNINIDEFIIKTCVAFDRKLNS